MLTMYTLQKAVKNGVVIGRQNGVYYADFAEDNGDEFRVAACGNIDTLFHILSNNGLVK